MSAVPHSPSPYLPAFLTGTGAKVDSGKGGMTLAASTYFVPFGGSSSDIQSVMVTWDAAVIGVVTAEDSNDPDATNHSTSGREWTPENPSTAIVGVVGGTSIAATLTIPGGTAGSAMFHVGNTGALRNRLKAVLATGGNMNFLAHGKGS